MSGTETHLTSLLQATWRKVLSMRTLSLTYPSMTCWGAEAGGDKSTQKEVFVRGCRPATEYLASPHRCRLLERNCCNTNQVSVRAWDTNRELHQSDGCCQALASCVMRCGIANSGMYCRMLALDKNTQRQGLFYFPITSVTDTCSPSRSLRPHDLCPCT